MCIRDRHYLYAQQLSKESAVNRYVIVPILIGGYQAYKILIFSDGQSSPSWDQYQWGCYGSK